MRNPGFVGYMLGGFFALGGCVPLGSNRPPPLVVNVRNDGDNCRVTVQRDHFAQAPDFIRVTQAQLREIGRHAQAHRAIVIFDANAQYKCIGVAIITLQEAGLVVDPAVWDDR